MTRRTFLQAASATALVAASAHAAEPKRKIKIGFLGVAHSHAGGKIKAVRDSDDWELVGVAEESAKLRESIRQSGVRVLATEELLRECEVIAVESAVRDHFRQAKLALAAGRHVHVEKPPTTKLAEFHELLDLARERKRLLQMGYMWRYNPGFAKIFEAVRNGWLGEISLVRATMNSLYDASKPDGRRELAEFRGGGMLELGCHVIDQLVRLLGAPQKVSTTLRTHGGADTLADNSVAVFDFPKALGLVHINLLQPVAHPHRCFEVLGSNGSARLQPIEAPALTIELAKAAGPYHKGSQDVALPKYQRYVPELADLADAVRTGRALAVTPAEDLLVQEWVLKACEM
ncbi:MAG: Gfo/Idh/MocA family oxidoreductase [Verrucomicrobia bacterium]|nr:Gfo/Idh/MocA family oxidoreductase [Verrucomicrobiota bacterium]